MRRLERAGGDEDLAPCPDLLELLALPVFDADRALALEQDARCLRIDFDAQIGAIAHMRVDVSARSAPALAVLLRHLVNAEAFVVLGIEILADAKLPFLGGLQK